MKTIKNPNSIEWYKVVAFSAIITDLLAIVALFFNLRSMVSAMLLLTGILVGLMVTLTPIEKQMTKHTSYGLYVIVMAAILSIFVLN